MNLVAGCFPDSPSSQSGSSDFSGAKSNQRSGNACGAIKSKKSRKSHNATHEKPSRIRTVLSEKQLHTLRACYAANPRPDALMKDQLVEMTGLSPRVIRVWFQNKRYLFPLIYLLSVYLSKFTVFCNQISIGQYFLTCLLICMVSHFVLAS